MSEETPADQRQSALKYQAEVARELERRLQTTTRLRAEVESLRGKIAALGKRSRFPSGAAGAAISGDAYREGLRRELVATESSLHEAEEALKRAEERKRLVEQELAELEDSEGTTR